MKTNFFEILKKSQDDLMQYVICRLEENGYADELYITPDYVYARGNIPVLLVAHLDTVHDKLPTIYCDKKQGVIWSPQGIGGDDRCGVYGILKITEKYKPYVLFTTDEEVGGTGATAFTQDVTPELVDVNFAIEIDRRGFNQAVFYKCGNEDFKKMILSYGFNEENGTFTDISIIAPKYNIAAVNLSAGYYNEHTCHEYININDLRHTIHMIECILKSNVVNNYYEFKEKIYNYQVSTFKDIKNDDIKTKADIIDNCTDQFSKNQYINKIEDWYDMDADEWKTVYGTDKPKRVDELYDDYYAYYD